jgi:predicted GNAT family N-acyltransferase
MSYNNMNQLTDAQIVRLHTLFRGEWWTAERELEDVRTMLAANPYIYGVCETTTGRLSGFARVLSDSVFKALLLDVIVDPADRGHGIGEKLMKSVLSDPRLARVKHFELYCLPELEPFYERLGFSADVGGVRLMRYAS